MWLGEVSMGGNEVSKSVVKWSEVQLGEVQRSGLKVFETGCLTLLEDIGII